MTQQMPAEINSSAFKEARLENVRVKAAQWFTSFLNVAVPPINVSVAARGDYDEVLVFLPSDYVERAEAQTHALEQAFSASGTPAYVYVRSNGQTSN